MKKYIAVFTVCLLFFISCSKKADIPISKEADIPNQESLILYVAPNAVGEGSGFTEEDAADFLEISFWTGVVQERLSSEPVEVQFLAGNYSRAYTEKPLVFDNLGNPGNRLTIRGNKDVIFTLPNSTIEKPDIIFFKGGQNITIDNLHFTGNGRIAYTLRFGSIRATVPTTNILVENCTWTDMGGVVYGATGAHYGATSNVTYKNCTFKRIGLGGGSHMIYNAYGSQNVRVIDSHFEDCMGDYIRFRAGSDYGIVRGSTFIRKAPYPDRPFISSPLFNDRATGDEEFPTNLSYTNNKFINKGSTSTANVITFYHSGTTTVPWDYLLTDEEGNILQNGSVSERKALLEGNFGIFSDLIRINGNTYEGSITNIISLGTFRGFLADKNGFEGWGVITDLFPNNDKPFPWEE